MRYTVTESFYDETDGRYLYRAGDSFPRAGISVSNERIEVLKGNNRYSRAFIREEKESGNDLCNDSRHRKPDKTAECGGKRSRSKPSSDGKRKA